MASKTTKAMGHEKRKGEAALSDFAEYVEKQQALRYPSSKAAPAASGPAEEEKEDPHHHAELDDILDALDLSDSGPRVPLRELLLGTDEATLHKLVELVAERLEEGHGESLFEIGFENNGDSMHLTKDDWSIALARLQEAATTARSSCQLLLTKNVGGEVEGATNAKDKDCSGKVLIRQNPATVEDVIETRIAVVGNGMSSVSAMHEYTTDAC